ncbi:MAG TPA: efflux RND transporter periplasmic adaptor subunit [Phycisphaerae bacterium]|nr:efflux RND transporter periplasmic adaptor subunit [Phycisphaerae bacterium]
MGLLLAAATFAACKPAAFQMPPRPPSPVTVAVAETHDVPVYLDEIGQTQPSEKVDLQAQVSGQIIKRHFTDGADLKKGAPLFSIDPRTYKAAVEQAEANLEQARAQQALAQAEFDRYAAALKVKAANQADYDAKKAALDTAIAQVKVFQAALDTAKINLDYCEITSPINGRAGERLVDEGNIVKLNDTRLLQIQNLSPIYVDFTIVEADLPRLRAAMSKGDLQTVISLPQIPGVTHAGSLTFLDTNVQAGAGRIHLRATLPNEDRYFWPGQFVDVRLVLSTLHNAVLVPFSCTQQGQQGPFVYIIKDGDAATKAPPTVEQRPVELGQRQTDGGRDLIVIASGVKPGERVVQTGQLAIGPGAPVNIVPDTLNAPAGAPAASDKTDLENKSASATTDPSSAEATK